MIFRHVLLLHLVELSPDDLAAPLSFFSQIDKWNLTVTHASCIRTGMQDRALNRVCYSAMAILFPVCLYIVLPICSFSLSLDKH